MEENNNIFLVAVMLLCTWPDQYTQNFPQHLSGTIHLERSYFMTDFSTPLPIVRICTHLEYPLHLENYYSDCYSSYESLEF